ncbi:MAG: DUF742 domain-containing protein [Actinomycetota bacterium]
MEIAAHRRPSGDLLGAAPLARSFTLTKGRTTSENAIPVDVALCRPNEWRRNPPPLPPIESEMYRLAGDRLSPAEMAAQLRLPIGVVRVLAGDLLAAGHLRLGTDATRHDTTLLRRLIHGLRSR